MLASMLQRVPAISYRWLAGWTIMWQARENGLFYARFNLCGDWHCWLSLSGLLLPAKVGSFRRWPLHDVLDRLTHIGDVYGSLASDLTLHIRRLENGLERPRGRSRPAPRHLGSLVAADAFAG